MSVTFHVARFFTETSSPKAPKSTKSHMMCKFSVCCDVQQNFRSSDGVRRYLSASRLSKNSQTLQVLRTARYCKNLKLPQQIINLTTTTDPSLFLLPAPLDIILNPRFPLPPFSLKATCTSLSRHALKISRFQGTGASTASMRPPKPTWFVIDTP